MAVTQRSDPDPDGGVVARLEVKVLIMFRVLNGCVIGASIHFIRLPIISLTADHLFSNPDS